ncbi:MAG TPA: histidinol-phosphate transaminase [Candidatus Limnocylindrales bacterium]|nr:histidinol-phosphate transaminase [Candidatus Limnocylindrales bacterium]
MAPSSRGPDLVSRRIRETAGYTPGEQPTDRSLIKLNTNENPYPCSPLIAEAIETEAHRLNLYPSPMADMLRVRAAETYRVKPSQVLAGNGSDELLAILLRACTEPGEAIAYPVPTYSLYRVLANLEGVRAIEVPADGNPIPRALAEAPSRVTFLSTPNSPTGLALPLDAIAEFARNVSGVVVADEAYVDFGGASALAILADHPNLVVTRSFSKSFSLAGLRLGLLFAHEDFAAELAKVKDSYNVSRLAIAAGVAALEDIGWMQNNVARIRATRVRVTAALRRAGYTLEDSQANFLWVDCTAKGGGRGVYEKLRDSSVLVRFFEGDGLAAGIRVSIGTDDEMDKFLDVMSRI